MRFLWADFSFVRMGTYDVKMIKLIGECICYVDSNWRVEIPHVNQRIIPYKVFMWNIVFFTLLFSGHTEYPHLTEQEGKEIQKEKLIHEKEEGVQERLKCIMK